MDSPVDHSRELGRRMLQGWAMLAENCPGEECAVPLLRSPDRSHTLCVNCRRETRITPATEGDATSADATSATLNGSSGSPSQARSGTLGTLGSFLGARAPPSRLANAPTQEASTPINGPLQETSPLPNGPIPDSSRQLPRVNGSFAPTPPFQSSNSRLSEVVPMSGGRDDFPVLMNGHHSPHSYVNSPLSDVSRGRDREAGYSPFSMPRGTPADAHSDQAADVSTLAPGTGAPQSQEGGGVSGVPHGAEAVTSARGAPVNPVSVRLLQGWTMLGEFCPTCYNPIMRSRTGAQRCVVCPEAHVTGNAVAETARESAPAEAFTAADTAALHQETPAFDAQDVKMAAEMASQPQHEASGQLPYDSDASLAALDPSCILERMHQTVLRKMHALRGELERTSDIPRLAEVFRAVSECASAIKNLKSIM